MYKVGYLGITCKFGIMLNNFLPNQKHLVQIGGEISPGRLVVSDIPHGTVLGPMLFLILMSDIVLEIFILDNWVYLLLKTMIHFSQISTLSMATSVIITICFPSLFVIYIE